MRTLIMSALALGLMVIAASAARADTFACVNTSSGTPKIVDSCTVGTNASPCHNDDICIDLSLGGTDLKVVCETESVGPLGGFNVDAICPADHPVAIAGGYQCTDSNGHLLAIIVDENTFHFNGTSPNGWQTIGSNNTTLAGTAPGNGCRVCATCASGVTVSP
jgi:hypothetical protein